MKILWAQLKKDIIAARGLFLAWAVCTALNSLLALLRYTHAHLLTGEEGIGVFFLASFVMGTTSSLVLQWIFAVILVVRVIHADPLTELDAFWRTRPVSRSSLLTEKVLLIALLVCGEVLIGLFLFRSSGSSRANTSSNITLLQVLEFALGLAAFAAITPDLTKLIITFFLIAFASQVSADLLLRSLRNTFTFGVGPNTGLFGHPESWEIALFYIAGFIAVIVWQYFTLRTNIARGILFATFLLAALWQGR